MNVRKPALGALSIFAWGRVAGAMAQRCSPFARPMPVLLVLGAIAGFNGSVSVARASSSCPNEGLRTGPSANLPDCRAYEMVSPPDKNGGEVDGGLRFGTEPGPQQAAANGEAVTYASQTTFTEANPLSALTSTQYLSRRGSDGWVTKAITPRQEYPGGSIDSSIGTVGENLFTGFSEDLGGAFLVANEPSPVRGAPPNYYNPYLQESESGAYRLLSTVVPPVQKPGQADEFEGLVARYAGMSVDHSHVVFSTNDALTPEAVPGRENLYEWAGGHLELVSILPNGKPDVAPHYGNGTNSENRDYSHAISADGKRAFWIGSEGEIYMHEITADGARTVQVSASQKTGSGGSSRKARYWTASSDGSLVYFTSCAQLTQDSTAGIQGAPLEEGVCEYSFHNFPTEEDLYRYDANTHRLTDLTVDHNAGETAYVRGVLGASADGSEVYFVATGVLAPGASTGTYNLYLWHEGTTTFIASLGSEVEETGANALYEQSRDWAGGLVEHTSRVSPSGQYLVFQSVQPLTGYDNMPSNPSTCFKDPYPTEAEEIERPTYILGGRCMEVFEYNASTNKLICASCNPSGAPPLGESLVPTVLHGFLFRPLRGWQTPTVQQRYLLDDGRLFFQSRDAVLPQASNGTQNIYEYEPDRIGSCASAGGCVSLISSGTSNSKSYFLDASENGNDVFIITRQQLVSQDGDEAGDVYDARADGGFSSSVPPPCGGEACRPPTAPSPSIYGAPPSATFSGPGNPLSEPVKSPRSKKIKKSRGPKKAINRKTKNRNGARGRVRTHNSTKGGRR